MNTTVCPPANAGMIHVPVPPQCDQRVECQLVCLRPKDTDSFTIIELLFQNVLQFQVILLQLSREA